MLPSFYKIWKRAGPNSIGESLGYVFGSKTSTGEFRIEAPEHLAGVDRETMEILGADCAADGNFANAIGSLNFEEKPTLPELREIFQSFIEFTYIGVDRPKRCYVGVRHVKRLKMSKALSVDIHFLTLPVLLGCGRVFQSYFHRRDKFGYELWMEHTNYKFGLSSPFDASRRRVCTPRAYSSDTPAISEFKRDVGVICKASWEEKGISGPQDVIDLLYAMGGVIKATHNKYGVSVTVADIQKPVNLTAMIFARAFNAEATRERLASQRRRKKEEVEEDYKRILKLRADEHFRRFGQPTVAWTYSELDKHLNRKEPNHGTNRYSSEGRQWNAVLRADEFFESEIFRLGKTCERIGRGIGQIDPGLGNCLEITLLTRPASAGFESPIDRLGRGAGELQRLIDRLSEKCRNREVSDRHAGIQINIAGIIDAINRAAQRLAFEKEVTPPKSASAVERAVVRLYQSKSISEEERGWFTFSPVAVKPDVMENLSERDPSGSFDLRETLRNLGAFDRDETELEPHVEIDI